MRYIIALYYLVFGRPDDKKGPVALPSAIFELWALGNGDVYTASDAALPIHPLRRLFWRIRGEILTTLFDWWWWSK